MRSVGGCDGGGGGWLPPSDRSIKHIFHVRSVVFIRISCTFVSQTLNFAGGVQFGDIAMLCESEANKDKDFQINDCNYQASIKVEQV